MAINKRLRIKESALKTLFAYSGNVCAFDGCKQTIINEFGDVHGEIAHIRSVGSQGKKAARYDPNATAEELRDFDNLILLCHEHHVETDNEQKYPVEKMITMKAKHEARFNGLISELLATVGDQTKNTSVVYPVNFEAYRAVHPILTLNDDEISGTKDGVIIAIGRLAKLPPNARAMLAVIADRADSSFDYLHQVSIPVETLRSIMDLSHTEFDSILTTLIEYDYVKIEEDYEAPWRGERIILRDEEDKSGLQIFTEVILISRALGIPTEELVLDLDWSKLDT